MFEFSIAFKYLIPRKKHLSVTLIAMMSVAVISLIVWLLLVFLSVTSGIESSWLKKLTDLHAPLRVTPTAEYYSSYYYKVDSLSGASDFSLKTLGEKKEALLSDPYNPEEDPEIPSHWQKPAFDGYGSLIDPVKGLIATLAEGKSRHQGLFFQDYQMSGALLKLQLLRNQSTSPFSSGHESMNFLTQVSYLSTPPVQEKTLASLLIPPSAKDINHLFFLANYRMEKLLENGAPSVSVSSSNFSKRLEQILPFLEIQTVKTSLPAWKFPPSLLPENTPFTVFGSCKNGIWHFVLPASSSQETSLSKGTLTRKGSEIHLAFGPTTLTFNATFLLPIDAPLIFKAHLETSHIASAKQMQDLKLHVEGYLQGRPIQGTLSWKDLLIEDFTLLSKGTETLSPPWAYTSEDLEWKLPTGPSGEAGILLPKGFQDSGVFLGDVGFLSYQASTSGGAQEQRLPVFVAGFYDPGIISVGSKCLLVPKEITKAINSSHTPFTFDKISLEGFQVWIDSPQQADLLKQELQKVLEQKGLLPYWTVTSYKDYDFAKDLLLQFQSDKMLLSLIGTIILIVACSNIISFLILLVNDKKKEIAILQAMGARTKSIALIFGLCGMFVGLLGCILGTCGALLTLSHIDAVAELLSVLQGHEAFHPAFYGNSLPDSLSSEALVFIFIATPALSLLSGLIPALKACRLSPSSILRSES